MKTNTIILTGYTAHTERAGPLMLGTAGSYGNEQLQIRRGDGWEDLNVRVVFHPCGAELLVPEDGILEVPWEATARPLARGAGRLIFQGVADGRVVNTADLFYEVYPHSPAEGGPPQERTPVLSEELLKRVYEIGAAAESSAQSAQSAALAAGQAQSSAQEAARAEKGAENAERLGVKHAEEAAAQNAEAQQATQQAIGAAKNAALSEAHALDSAETAANSAAAATGKAEEAGEMARVAEGSASSAAGSAAAASTSASSAAASAEAAQRNANAAEGSARGAADTLADVERRLSLGELKGEKGDPGEQGPQGAPGANGKDAVVDSTLTQSGQAADAQAVGDKFRELSEEKANQADVDELKGDLDSLLADVNALHPLTITAFSVFPSLAEKGSTVSAQSFSYSVNRAGAAVTLEGAEVSGGTASRADVLTEDRLYTLRAVLGVAVQNKTAKISFVAPVYYGVGMEFEISAMTCKLQTSRSMSFTVSAGAGRYILLALPVALGVPTFKVGGFEGGFELVDMRELTNASGHTESYRLYRSTNAGLGSTTVSVT